jgi:hypothetical protein
MITNYVLQISPYKTTSWTNVTTYDGSSMSHQLSVGTDAIVTNAQYRFRILAKNAYGESPFSEELTAAIAPLPSKPAPVIKV